MHDHHHRGYDHPHPDPPSSSRALALALTLTLGYAAVEAIAGWAAGSLALLSDAGHMLTDSGSLALAAAAAWLAQRPPSRRHSYGLGRAETLAALINALLGFIGSSTGLNALLIDHFNKPLSLELLFGLVFQFIAFILGVPWKEALDVGSLMGIKLVVNEFVAYLKMSDVIAAGQLSTKSIVIATYALCGFANFSSIAIQIGGLSPLAENRRSDIARLGLKAVLGGTIATWMTAAIAGLLTN